MLVAVDESRYDDDFLELINVTIFENKHIPDYIKQGILDYPEELSLLYEANKVILDPNSSEQEINELLCGGARFGGKTLMGAVLALQFIEDSSFKCLVTRSVYKDLIAKGKDSIWGYIKLWQNEIGLPENERLIINKHDRTITDPNGGFISFIAFNYDDKADSLQSKTYHRIISDESPQLSLNIIEDFLPTLRQDIDEYFPLSLIHFGNPQLNNPVVNDWFGKTFVTGALPYINMDLNNNPLINREAYKQSFKRLSKAKKEVFLYGNWFYVAEVGDLISQVDLNNAKTNVSSIDYNTTASILFLDLAGRGKDKFAITTITILPNDLKIIDNITQTKAGNAVKAVKRHISEDNVRGVYPSLAIIEMEAGSWVYTEEYWINMFLDNDIIAESQKPAGNKYIRAIPATEEIISKELLINQDLENKFYIEDDLDKDYFSLLSGEAIGLMPIMKISPNIFDTISLGVNYINNNEISIE
jgi:hypothetical protein